MPTLLDLFSGCGGLSLGAHQAGFKTVLAIDSDPILSSSYPRNFPHAELLRTDIRSVGHRLLKEKLPGRVDGVVGGPPCQAFSEMGRRDRDDPRRLLVLEYFRVISLVRPKFFLFENVPGLALPNNIRVLEDGLASLSPCWRIVGPRVVNAADFGAPTKRRRLFAFGFDTSQMDVPLAEDLFALPKAGVVSVRDAISDLQTSGFVGNDKGEYDYWSYDKRRSISAYAERMRTKTGQFTGHRKTEHNKATIKRFSRLEPGGRDNVGKYVRLRWDGLCPTLRAGTGNDRGSYQAVRPIHPMEDRVITAREAARLQGFPDDFLFHPTVWHSCRMIGNSVSPILARALLERIKSKLTSTAAVRIAAE